MTKNIELPVVSKSVGGLSRESLETLAAVEASLTAQDTTEADRLNYKNAVEEYIYDIRDKVILPELYIQIIFFQRVWKFSKGLAREPSLPPVETRRREREQIFSRTITYQLPS